MDSVESIIPGADGLSGQLNAGCIPLILNES